MVAPGASAALASRLLGRELDGERPLAGDPSTGDVVVAEQVLVSWVLPPVPTPHPGVELLTYLTQHGFAPMPHFLGAPVEDDLVLAVVTEFVTGATGGWDWFVSDVDTWLTGGLALHELVHTARRLGELTAELHTALAGLQRSAVGTRTYHAEATDSLHEALRVVDGPEWQLLTALEVPVRTALEPLRVERQLPAHRIHGHLNAGSFLRAGGRLLVTDFHGDPLADTTQRRLPQTPLRDVASLLQSIDHVGRVAVHRGHPGRDADVERFIASAVDAALAAYSSKHPVDRGVLRALRVSSELREYRYAAAHRRDWMHVPDAALPALLANP